MLPNCRSMRCKILCPAWRFIVCAHKFSLAERNFEEKLPFVQVNYCLIHCKISCKLSSELSSQNHGNKERNSRISLALLLYNTVPGLDITLAARRKFSFDSHGECRDQLRNNNILSTHNKKCVCHCTSRDDI